MKLAAKMAGVTYRWERTEVAAHLRVWSGEPWNSKASSGKFHQVRCALLYSPCFAGKNVQNFGLIREIIST